MACFYPLYKLFLFDIIGATDAKSLQMILETGYRFFLVNDVHEQMEQSDIESKLKIICNEPEPFLDKTIKFNMKETLKLFIEGQPELLKKQLDELTEEFKDSYL